MHAPPVEQVRALLTIEDPAQSWDALTKQSNRSPHDTLAALVGLLEHPDESTRRRAGGGLSLFSKLWGADVNVEQHAETLAHVLEHGSDPRVRLSCAIALMPVRGPAVDHAFLRALADSADKVVQIACVESWDRGGVEVIAALLARLEHPSWRVRLEVCKALIQREVGDPRVLSTLEAMRREPEAAVYDAEVGAHDPALKEFMAGTLRQHGAGEAPVETWGKLEAILAKARAVGDRRLTTGQG